MVGANFASHSALLACQIRKMIEISDRSTHPHASKLNHAAYGRGCEHFNRANYYLAVEEFETALEYWPGDWQAWFALGNCWDEAFKPKKAESCFRKSLELSPQEKIPNAYYNLGNSLYDQNRLEEAIECYNLVPENHPLNEAACENSKLAKRDHKSAEEKGNDAGF